MSRKLVLFMSLIFLSQVFFVLPVKSTPDHFPPAAVVGRYVLHEDRFWIAYNKTVQQLRDEGYDILGDPDWLLQVNYTRLGYTYKYRIVELFWPNITLELTQGEHDLNVTAHRIMEDGSIGEKLTSFLRVNQPPYIKTWESQDPNLGVGFNPSVFVVGNTFSGELLEYNVNRTEILTDTPWGQNETYVLQGYFANSSHCYKNIVSCDSESGIMLKQIWDQEIPMFVSHEEQKIAETGIKFEVVHGGESYEVSIDTNSTIIAFDSSATKITLTVNGSTGTVGTCNITIAKELVPTDHSIEVYIDDQKTDYQLAEDEDNYYVYIEYQHSAHIITISFVTTPIWMQWWFWIIVTIGVMVLAGAVYFLKRRKPSSPNVPSQLPPKKTGASIK